MNATASAPVLTEVIPAQNTRPGPLLRVEPAACPVAASISARRTDALNPCPLCGALDGYTITASCTRVALCCAACGDVLTDCKGRIEDDRTERTDLAWNQAGAYAAGLLAERDALRAELGRLRAQEPVAWIARAADGRVCCWTSAYPESIRLARERGRDLQPLYAAPAAPVAQPLAEEKGVMTTPGK